MKNMLLWMGLMVLMTYQYDKKDIFGVNGIKYRQKKIQQKKEKLGRGLRLIKKKETPVSKLTKPKVEVQSYIGIRL